MLVGEMVGRYQLVCKHFRDYREYWIFLKPNAHCVEWDATRYHLEAPTEGDLDMQALGL